ncbi:MarR family transcriptional regulator [Rubrobacter marinus]|uniref:MarR family transcriptional regulator n=1 Tax=Rubrobacter marinus TaxID=2653852 RepID=A0A6G8Q0V4_9ACTN|nr:MarR family transcriptional regulator [Rubrobacter marinus]QIN80093.1 MarR family transcriptional regulator [Rubrobacter marinus]
MREDAHERENIVALEAAAGGAKEKLRLWLRALTFTNLVEGRVRARLRDEYGVTLPRFDMMAALHDAPDGLSMGEVSRRLMVSNGNVTGIAERLEREGLIVRRPMPGDRRSQIVRLTEAGRAAFEEMAVEHEAWIAGMLSGLSEGEVETLHHLLGKAKRSVLGADEGEESA